MKTDSRVVYYDYLRIIAVFWVIVIHVVAEYWGAVDVKENGFAILNGYDSLARWAVPAYAMISGSLFLSKKRDIKTIYKKNVLRIVTAFLFWSAIYAFATCRGVGAFDIVLTILGGQFHMWFLLMILGMYISLPLFYKIAEDIKTVKYLIVIAFIFTSVIPWIIKLLYYFGGPYAHGFADVLRGNLDYMNLGSVTGYIGYFFAGYYISNTDIDEGKRKLIYILGIVGFVATFYLTRYHCIRLGYGSVEFYGDTTVNIVLTAVAIFTFAKYHLNGKSVKLVSFLGRTSFGAYLVHVLVIKNLQSMAGFSALNMNLAAGILLETIIVFAISFAISAVLNCIPGLNKYIV